MVDLIIGSIERVVGKDISFVVEHPGEESHGDYASNVAMILGGNPREKAGEMKIVFEKDKKLMEVIEKIEIAGQGFINFWLKKEYLVGEMLGVNKDYGKGDWGKGKRILVDYSAPNIAKDFSVGHLRSTIIGQSIRNLYEFSGWKSVGDNHLGDWGTQFGMIIAAVEEANLDIEKMSVSQMEELYVKFNERVKEDESLKEKAKEAFVRLEKGDEKARLIWEKSVQASMKEFGRIYEILGVEIEHAYGEGFYVDLWGEIIEDAKKQGLAKMSEGALVMELGEGLPLGIFLKSDGGTTYFTRDLATIKFRQNNPELKSDLYVYEVGSEQSLYFRQVFAAAEKLGWGGEKDFVHVAHGMVLGGDGKKMSTRKGTGMKMEELLNKAIEKAGKINEASAQKVGVGAVKYFDLRHSPETTYRFDIEEALSLDGNSGPYLQYCLVRCRSVLEKANLEGSVPFGVGLNGEEMGVLRWLYRFPEVVEDAAKSFSPNLVCNYLFELAQRFNSFYNKHRILESEDEAFRLGLTKSVGQVLANGLGLLGIEVVERM